MKLRTLVPILCVWTAMSGPFCFAQEVAASEVDKLKALLAEQQRQIEALRQAVSEQQKMIEGLVKPAAFNATAAPAAPAAPAVTLPPEAAPRPVVASTTPMAIPGADAAPSPKFTPPFPQGAASGESPLQLKIGETTIIPIGFMDLTLVFRDKNAGSGIGTNFASIPFYNTQQGHLSEIRFSPQNSRVGFRMDTTVHGAHVMAYNETDFLGNTATNAGVTNGAFVPRLRLFWVDVRKDQFEFLAGQSWSMLTPNRKGISPLPGDIFYSQVMDVNYLIGLPWDRQPGVRFVYHPTDKVAWGFSLEDPNQYIGGSAGAPVVTFPAALTAMAGVQFDNTSGSVLSTPNLTPDFLSKIAFDPSASAHIEIAGIVRTFRDWNLNTNQHFTKTGGGGSINANFEIAKGFRIISNNHVGDGTGRYLFGTAPDLVVRADGSISPIHDVAFNQGFEYTHKNTLIYAYWGGAYISKNVVVDANGTSLVGYGYRGSGNNNNNVIEEVTAGGNQTLWKDPKWGALNFIYQYQYTWRYPWYVASGQPANAHNNAVYLDLRYSLPGAPPPAK